MDFQPLKVTAAVSNHGEDITSEAIRESAFVKMYLADHNLSVHMLAGWNSFSIKVLQEKWRCPPAEPMLRQH